MHFKNICFVLLFIMFHDSITMANKCDVILGEVGNTQSRFVDCMIKNSTKEACISCGNYKMDMKNTYTKLLSNINCSKEYIDKNRFNVVYNMQRSLLDIWNKGFCDDCFVSGETSDEFKFFSSLATNFTTCLARNMNKSIVCIRCSGEYSDLNTFYKHIDEAKKGKLCFDIQDTMNRSRSHWSKDLNCCHREYSLMLFTIASSIFGTLIFVFYLGMYVYTKRIEGNHEILDATATTTPTDHATTSTGLRSGSTSNTETRSTTEAHPYDNISNKLKKHRDASYFKNQSKDAPKTTDLENFETLNTQNGDHGTGSQNTTNEHDPLINLI